WGFRLAASRFSQFAACFGAQSHRLPQGSGQGIAAGQISMLEAARHALKYGMLTATAPAAWLGCGLTLHRLAPSPLRGSRAPLGVGERQSRRSQQLQQQGAGGFCIGAADRRLETTFDTF